MGLETVHQNAIRQSIINNGHDPDLLIEALEEYINDNRQVDKNNREILGTDAFYEREIKYSKIEKFIIALKAT